MLTLFATKLALIKGTIVTPNELGTMWVDHHGVIIVVVVDC